MRPVEHGRVQLGLLVQVRAGVSRPIGPGALLRVVRRGESDYQVTALRFPAEIAVGEVWWEDAPEWGHLLAIGVVEVPDGTAVRLEVSEVAEVSVSNQMLGWNAPAGTAPSPAPQPGPVRERVTWQRGMPDSALRNNRSIWGEPGKESYSVECGDEPVDLEFIRGLPADSVFDLSLSDVVPASFAAVAHLAPGLRGLGLFLDDLSEDAAAVIAELTALESLALCGNYLPEDGPSPRLDDHALSEIADLPALESLSLLGGSYTELGLQQPRRLPKLRHLHIEKEGLTAPMFRCKYLPNRNGGLELAGALGSLVLFFQRVRATYARRALRKRSSLRRSSPLIASRTSCLRSSASCFRTSASCLLAFRLDSEACLFISASLRFSSSVCLFCSSSCWMRIFVLSAPSRSVRSRSSFR